MAISKEKILEIMNQEGDSESKADSLSVLITEDFNDQLNAIKANKEELKLEKTNEIAKRQAVEAELAKLQEENKKLNKEIKNLAPEEVEKVFDQRLQEQTNIFTAEKQALQKDLDNYKNQVAELTKVQLKMECMEEFNKAIKGLNIASDSIEDFSTFVMGVDCSKFAKRPIGDGKTILATKDGLSIKQAVEAAKETTFGKNCILVNSTGGSAEGGARKVNTKDNPFITNNKTQQALLLRNDPRRYYELKAQAENR